MVRRASETNVEDTTSGFRAYNREAALQMQVVSKFTYTLETIIQAGKMLVAIDHVPIRTNPKTRESRLFPSMAAYVRRNSVSIFRIYALYEPLRVFMTLALLVGFAALVLWGRFAFFLIFESRGSGHVQSLILGAVLFLAAIAARSTRRDGRHPRGQPRAQPAHPRARAAHRAEDGHRAVALRAWQSAARGGFEQRRGARRRRAAHRRARGGRSCDAGSRRGGSHRQHLRQVRLDQPGGATADDRLPSRAGRALGAGLARVGARRGLRRGRAHRTSGQAGSATGASWASTSDDPKLQAEWEKRQRPNLEYRVEEATSLSFADDEFDVATAIEVLEHVPDPDATLAEMTRVARSHLLVSVPREPLWRIVNMARGAYWKSLGNTPGHVNHWSRVGFVSLLTRHGTVEEIRSPFPWTMLLVRVS